MKLFIIHNYYQQRGGEDAVFEAETALLKADGHEVECFTMHNDTVAERSKIGLVAATIWNGDVHRALKQRLAAFAPDIVHFHNIFPLISPAALYAAKKCGAATVITLHNFRFLCPSANLYRNGRICEDCLDHTVKWPAILHGCYRDSHAQTLAVTAMLAIHREAGRLRSAVDRYVTLSDAARLLFVRAGFPNDRIAVKPNFVQEPPRAQWGVDREPFVLFVGRLVPEKGILTLLAAWRGSEAPPWSLVIVGDGPLAPQVAAAGGKVRWVGRKSRTEIDSLMRRASLLAFPSEWYEPFGLVAIEAFANGLPVLAARIGAAEELIDCGRTGFLFPPGDPVQLARAVHHAIASPEALASMGKACELEYQMKYTATRNVRLLLEIYDDAIDQHVRRGGGLEQLSARHRRHFKAPPVAKELPVIG
jgi:glycosyltransferase involved in cell wall biosynthesis